jgi:type II secretory pathway component PulC
MQFKEVSADAKWLAHVDVDAMRSSAVMKKLGDECLEGGRLGKCFDKMTQQCGMDPREDLHGLTLYGTKIARGHGVLIIRADMDRDLLVEKAKKAPDYRTVKHRSYEIHTWTQRKSGQERKAAGALHKPDVLVLASSVGLLEKALDVLDGRVAGLKAGEKPLAAEVPKGTMFLARAMEIRKSPVAETHPLCSQLSGFDYAEGEHEGRWSGYLTFTAENEEVAERVESALKGLRAVLWLEAKPAPKLQQLLDKVDFDQDGEVVTAKFKSPVEEVAAAMPGACELVRRHMVEHRVMAKYGKKEGPSAEKSVEKKKAPKKPGTKAAKPEAPEKGAVAGKPGEMQKPTARQGTAVLGVVIAKPLDVEAAEVIRVWEDSPAEKAGLQPGDRIVEVDGEKINSPEGLRAAVLRHQPGDKIDLVVRREGKKKEFQARLAGGDDFGGWARPGRLHRLLSPRPWLGVRIGSGAGRGVSVAGVLPGSPADRAGLKQGDAILRVDKTRVEAPADLQMAIAGYRPGETVRLVILDDDSRKEIEVELGAFGIWEGEIDGEPRRLLKRFLEGRFPFSEDLRDEREGTSSQETR